MRFASCVLAFAIAAMFAAVPAQSPAATVSSVAATVDNAMITNRELDKRMLSELTARGISLDSLPESQKGAIRRDVLNAMIDEILVRHAAEKNGITITQEQIDNEIKTRREEAGLSEEAFADLMKKQGMDDAKLRETVELSLMGQALVLREVFSKIVIPDSEIEQFYVQNGGVLTGPRIRIALIVYPDDETAGKMAKSAGKKLSNFNETAKEVSVGPNAEDGGDMGSMSLTDLAPAVRDAVTDVKAGKSTGIFSLEGQPAQAFVIERESGDNSGIDPEVRRNIENRLKSARVDEYLRTYLDQLREKALVTVR